MEQKLTGNSSVGRTLVLGTIIISQICKDINMEKLECQKCHEVKEVINFSINKKRKRGYHVWCKACVKQYDHNRHKRLRTKILKQKKEWRRKTREWFIDYKKTLVCEKCGETRWYVLTFHHEDKELKEAVISVMVSTSSIEAMKKEIEKCKVLCSNCHLEEHFFERQQVG